MVPDAFRWIAGVFGLALVIVTAGSLMRTLVVPRGVSSRLSVFVSRRVVRRTFLWISDRTESYAIKDRILALSAPMALVVVLIVWLLLFLLGFAMILWPLTGLSFAASLRESGSSMLTLGFAGQDSVLPTIVYFLAAVTGLIVIALQIAYLPTLYGAFNRRETLVTMLQSRAGAPAWGPEILARHNTVGLLDNLRHFYGDWEQWSADVAESHSTYPVLVWFRSPHPLRSWIVGLIAVLDSAALYQSVCPSTAPPETRLCIRMGFVCLRTIADAIKMPYDPDPFPDEPIELTYEEFLGGVHRLEAAHFPMERTPEEAWPHFKGWRVNYESIAYRLANSVVAPPGPWTGTRDHLPGMTIVPQRPTDRRPGDKRHEDIPKADASAWRA
ncbi:MAG TPA: hypothetical protein VNC78_08040 [Actinomycetota bacterium]|nr:hypothetical protein [Actinomycetota bacterium]